MSIQLRVRDSYLNGTYLENNLTWHVEDSPWKAKQICKLLSRNDISPLTICEVGCGAGEILVQLSREFPNANLCGYELSPQAYSLCKTREAKRVHYFNRNILEDKSFYDVLLCIDVFEHVEDYIGFIKALRCRATFKIFHVPLDINVLSVMRDAMMSERIRVGHLHYFTPKTAIATIADCGYEIVDVFYTKPFSHFQSKSFKGKLVNVLRTLFFWISPNLNVKILGGCALIVLAK